VAVTKTKIGEGVYQFTSAADGYVPTDNSVVVVNENDVLVFDTFSRVSTARTVLAEIRKITDKPVRYVVNSHHHPDHWSGNEVYAEAFPNVEIIATEEARELMLNLENSWPPVWTAELRQEQSALDNEISSGKRADGSPLTADQRRAEEQQVGLLRDWVAELLKVKRTHPTLTYTGAMTLRHGGREFRFMSVLGDASGTTVLYLPKEKILAAGDAVHYPSPDFNFNLSLNRHNESLKRLNELDVEVIIPGHGPALHDKKALQLAIELQDSVIRQVREIVKRGTVTAEEMVKLVNVDAIRGKFPQDDAAFGAQFQRTVNRMVENASKEARDGRKWEQ
jgi:glyoxylase-like metal-dependent hydrolase (beta-lactamase superfamily II)